MQTIKNRISLIGRVGNQPEFKTFSNDSKKGVFSLATNEYYYTSEGEKKELTYWHQIITWGKVSQIVERFIEKGQQIAIEGKITYRTYENKEGVKINLTEIIANEILLLD